MAIPESLAWVTSLIAVWATVWGVLQQIWPDRYRSRLFDALSPYVYYEVLDQEGFVDNELYSFVSVYLSSITANGAHRSHLLLPKNGREMQFTLSNGQYVYDTYRGVTARWEHKQGERKGGSTYKYGVGSTSESRQYELRLPRSKKGRFLEAYIASISLKSKTLDKANRELRLHSNRKKNNEMSFFRPSGSWHHIPFRHPASFETIALERKLKDEIVKDLEDFVAGKEFYRDVGKAWKRGYLLYGPPGTGKTSIVAAMANKLQYDIYDLELTEVKSNSDLRELLTYTNNKSIIVIEDIDCSLDLSGQRKKKKKKKESSEEQAAAPDGPPRRPDEQVNEVTLSGLLNFTDGLWSACEDERIFVFTTNYVNKLDPALVRSGRMDMHIHLSYITFSSFRSLVFNFFKINWHKAYPRLEQLFEEGAKIVPSEAAEILMRNRTQADDAMEKLEELLREKIANPPPPEPKPEDCGKEEEDEEEDKSSAEEKKVEVKKAEENKAEENKAEENKVEENKAEENKVEENKAEDEKTNSTGKQEVVKKVNEKSSVGEDVQESVQTHVHDKKND